MNKPKDSKPSDAGKSGSWTKAAKLLQDNTTKYTIKKTAASALKQKPRSGIKSAPGEGITDVQSVMPPPKNPTKRK